MPLFEVKLPIVGWAMVEVEAENATAAVEAALVSPELDARALQEWDAVRSLQGAFPAVSVAKATPVED